MVSELDPETPPLEALPTDSNLSRRLPAIAFPFLMAGAARGILPILIFMFISRREMDFFLIIVGSAVAVPALLSAIARFFAFSYRLEPEELVIRDGILTRKVRSVPYARIQNVDLVQNVIHRLLNVAVVRLETASGGKPEAEIRVLKLPAVDELRAHIQHRKSARSSKQSTEQPLPGSADALLAPENLGKDHFEKDHAADRPGHELIQVSLGRLALLGLLSNRGMLMVAATAGLAQQAGVFNDPYRFLPAPEQAPQIEAWIRSLETMTWDPLLVATAILSLGALLLLTTRLLSALWIMVTLFGFKLRLDEDDLRTEYGLLTRVTASVPRHRIQLLSIKESFLLKRAGLASVQIETAGGGADGNSGQGPGAARLWLAPLMDRAPLVELVCKAMPQIEFRADQLEDLDWQPLAAKAQARMLRRGSAFVLVVGALSAIIAGPWGLLSALLIPIVAWHAQLFIQRSGWALNEHAIFFRSGAWGLRTSVVPFAKIQGLRIVQTPFDRRNRMASVRVDTAGASQTGHRVDVPYLDTQTAHHLVEQLEHHAAELEFSW